MLGETAFFANKIISKGGKICPHILNEEVF